MLIVVSAVASAVALLGALLVGYSTQTTIKGMIPTRDPNSVLVAFPADVEKQLAQQQMTSTGVAIVQPPAVAQTPDQQAETLRNSIARATTATPTPDNQQQTQAIDMQQLAGKLEGLLLDNNQDPQNLAALKDYALRELTNQDGSVTLPNYEVQDLDLDKLGLSDEIATQISGLQSQLNAQIAQLPEVQGRKIDLQNIQLSGDPKQLAAAIDALGQQSSMLGLDFGNDARYSSLQDLGEQLLRNGDGSKASLEGLDMNELESISRDLLSQLNANGQTDGASDVGAAE